LDQQCSATGQVISMRVRLADTVLASALTAITLVAGAVALVFAEFGGPMWMLVALLLPVLTVGAPSLAAVLLLAWVWPGPSILAFAIASTILGFGFQFAAVLLIRRYVGRAGFRRANGGGRDRATSDRSW
jgi:hypothetical protein